MSEATNSELKLSILAPERILIQDVPVKEVTLTGSEGQIQILPGHAKMAGTHETGIFEFEEVDGTKKSGFISTGFFEVCDGQVSVTAETSEFSEEIDLERARRAEEAAKKALADKEKAMDEDYMAKYQMKLRRSMVRQSLKK